MFKNINNKGLTLIEIVVAVSIISIISVLFLFSYRNNRTETDLNNQTLSLSTTLRNAKQKSLSSQNSSTWGVHFVSNGYTIFQGSQFEGSLNNTSYLLPDNIQLYHFDDLTSCNQLTSDLVFNKLNGEVNQKAALALVVVGTSKYKTICVNEIGTIESSCSVVSPTPFPCPLTSPTTTITPTVIPISQTPRPTQASLTPTEPL